MASILNARARELSAFSDATNEITTSHLTPQSCKVDTKQGGSMQVQQEQQLNAVSDEVLALTAVVRPILSGVLYALRADIVAEAGGYEGVKLKMLPRLYRAGDGDCGICFEYAVHEAMNSGDGRVLQRTSDAAKLCKVPGKGPKSILFGLEKSGTQQIIDTADDLLTDDSRLLYGTRGQPAKLRRHLNTIAGAFRNRQTRLALPYSIRGLWKADLFVGFSDTDRRVATSVKINPSAPSPHYAAHVGGYGLNH